MCRGCVRKVDFGNVVLPANVRVPRPTVIGQFYDEANGVSSGNVTVRDVNSVNVKAFTCSCSQSGTPSRLHFCIRRNMPPTSPLNSRTGILRFRRPLLVYKRTNAQTRPNSCILHLKRTAYVVYNYHAEDSHVGTFCIVVCSAAFLRLSVCLFPHSWLVGRLTSPSAQNWLYRGQGLGWRFDSAMLTMPNDAVPPDLVAFLTTQNGKGYGRLL